MARSTSRDPLVSFEYFPRRLFQPYHMPIVDFPVRKPVSPEECRLRRLGSGVLKEQWILHTLKLVSEGTGLFAGDDRAGTC